VFLGAAYIILYLLAVVLAPILVLAAGIMAALALTPAGRSPGG
jgi:hypothetical protein